MQRASRAEIKSALRASDGDVNLAREMLTGMTVHASGRVSRQLERDRRNAAEYLNKIERKIQKRRLRKAAARRIIRRDPPETVNRTPEDTISDPISDSDSGSDSDPATQEIADLISDSESEPDAATYDLEESEESEPPRHGGYAIFEYDSDTERPALPFVQQFIWDSDNNAAMGNKEGEDLYTNLTFLYSLDTVDGTHLRYAIDHKQVNDTELMLLNEMDRTNSRSMTGLETMLRDIVWKQKALEMGMTLDLEDMQATVTEEEFERWQTIMMEYIRGYVAKFEQVREHPTGEILFETVDTGRNAEQDYERFNLIVEKGYVKTDFNIIYDWFQAVEGQEKAVDAVEEHLVEMAGDIDLDLDDTEYGKTITLGTLQDWKEDKVSKYGKFLPVFEEMRYHWDEVDQLSLEDKTRVTALNKERVSLNRAFDELEPILTEGPDYRNISHIRSWLYALMQRETIINRMRRLEKEAVLFI